MLHTPSASRVCVTIEVLRRLAEASTKYRNTEWNCRSRGGGADVVSSEKSYGAIGTRGSRIEKDSRKMKGIIADGFVMTRPTAQTRQHNACEGANHHHYQPEKHEH
jgi:hypothetical protein